MPPPTYASTVGYGQCYTHDKFDIQDLITGICYRGNKSENIY